MPSSTGPIYYGGLTLTRRWTVGGALCRTRTRGGVGEGIASVLGDARHARPDLVRGRVPRSGDVPARAGRGAARGVRRLGRGQRVPVRADPGPRRDARRARRPDRAAAGPPPRRRRAGHHERRDRGARARRHGVPRPGRPRPRRGPTYLGAIQSFRSFEAELAAVPLDERRARRRRARAAARRGRRPKLLYTIPDHQNPAGVSLSAERRERLVELARRTAS